MQVRPGSGALARELAEAFDDARRVAVAPKRHLRLWPLFLLPIALGAGATTVAMTFDAPAFARDAEAWAATDHGSAALASRHIGAGHCARYGLGANSPEARAVGYEILAAGLSPKLDDVKGEAIGWSRELESRAHAATRAREIADGFAQGSRLIERAGYLLRRSAVVAGISETSQTEQAPVHRLTESDELIVKSLFDRHPDTFLAGVESARSLRWTVDVEASTIAGLRLGMTRDEVRKTLGMPGPPARDGWTYQGLAVNFGVDQRVSEIVVDAPNRWLLSGGARDGRDGKLSIVLDHIELTVEHTGNYVVRARLRNV